MADFLLPMLHFDPEKRATAAEALKHPWLDGPPSEEAAAAAAADADEEQRQQRRRQSSHKRSGSPCARGGSTEDKRIRYGEGGNGRDGRYGEAVEGVQQVSDEVCAREQLRVVLCARQ
jgi:serine/threonine protein kinase